MRRFLGRRDVKVFLLLLIPVVWIWFLAADSHRRYPDSDLLFLDSLILFLGRVLGPGLILLGTAAGVHRHHSVRRSGGAARIWGDMFHLAVTFLAGALLLGAGFGAIVIGLPLTDKYRWGSFLDVPGAILFSDVGWYSSFWKSRSWIAGSSIGWILGYWFGRRWGRFLVALFAAAAIALFAANTIRYLSELHLSGECSAACGSYAGKAFSAALFMDTALVLTALLVAAFFVDTAVKTRRRVWWVSCCSVLVAIWTLAFAEHRGLYLHRADPWPPPATRVDGLDPVTNRLWFRSIPTYLNMRLFAIDYPSSPRSTPLKAPQVLYGVPEVRLSRHSILYDPTAPAILVMPDRFGMLLSPQRVCRLSRGVGTIDLGDGDWFWQTFPVRSPSPNWYAWADRDYEVVFLEAESGKRRRELRSRLALYCPSTGEQRTAISSPGAFIPYIGVRPWFRDNGYTIWPEMPGLPEAVPVEAAPQKEPWNIRSLLTDTFFHTRRSFPPDMPVYAFVNTQDVIGQPRTTITFEVNEPLSDGTIIKIPSPVVNRGCVWGSRGGRRLQVWDNWLVTFTLRDAIPCTDPVWSPDGRYLVYCSWADNGVTEVRLAYPIERILLSSMDTAMGTHDNPSPFWSPKSDWLAVGAGLSGDSPELVIVSFPDLTLTHITLTEKYREDERFRGLHDGSLAYIDDGKIYQWRPGWDDPICIYDPARKTVLR